ncbi:MAG: hypothetical protein KatS3mg094_151 [Candidatus Parcubacteria bacterium]|nr:MAG: hypothetical protein KatS3mg094_151 [Candidatus Parcubacteria bacterium]
MIIGSIYLYILLWLSLHAGINNDNIATGIALVIYTIIGLTAYLYGTSSQTRGLYIYGGSLIGAVVLRLLLVEVWKMQLEWRIVVFFSVGILLMSTVFFIKSRR